MNNEVQISYEQARVLDLLHQVKEVNKMIKLHSSPPADSFMVSQYQDQKNKFLIELKEVLSEFDVDVSLIQDKAA